MVPTKTFPLLGNLRPLRLLGARRGSRSVWSRQEAIGLHRGSIGAIAVGFLAWTLLGAGLAAAQGPRGGPAEEGSPALASGDTLGTALFLDGSWGLSIDDSVDEGENISPPSLADGSWRQVSLPGDWKSLGLIGHEGPVWFRRSVDIPTGRLTARQPRALEDATLSGGRSGEPAEVGDLAVDPSGLSIFVGSLEGGSYRVWADGNLIGSHAGRWNLPTPRPRVFHLPVGVISDGTGVQDGTVELAIRLDRVAWKADQAPTAPIFTEILVGSAEVLEHRRARLELQSRESARGGQIMAALLLAVGLLQLYLYFRRGLSERAERRGYLWLGLNSLDFAAATWLYAPYSVLGDAWPVEQRLVAMLLHLSVPPFLLFLWPFLGRKLEGLPLYYVWSQVVIAALLGLIPLEWLFLSEPLRWFWLLPFFLILVHTAATSALSGSKDDRYLAIGCSIMVVAGLAEGILQVAGLGTSDPLPATAFGIFLLCLLMAASQRYERNNSELLAFRQQLERMVEDRTAELSTANERLQAEIAERQLAEGAMRMLERAVEQSIDGIAVADLEGNMQFINEAWANLHGYEVFELLGYDLTIFHTDVQMRSQVQPLMERVAEEGAYSAEIEHRKRGGGTFPTWQTATCLLDPEGNPSGFVFIVRDITERKSQELERRRLEEKVRQAEKLESLGSLAGGIAHDYNNILTGVLGNTSLALHEADSSSDLFQRLRQIEASAERAAELTDQLLAYAGEEQQISRTLQLNELVQEHRPALDRVVARANARLEVHLKNNLPPIQGDPTQVLQAISNLLANAADSLEGTEDGGLIMLRTSVVTAKRNYFEGAVLESAKPDGSKKADGRYVFFEVSDTGMGMDGETRMRMFEPFFSTKSTGRGMGLAAVLGIVRAHDGNIRVFSQPGRGTTVEVLFPALEDAIREREESSAVPAWEGFGTALVVDDEQLVRDVAAKVLQRQGFEILTAVNGREALDIFIEKKDEIRLVLLDLTMPEMDGETFMREMQRFESDAKVLLMSGYRERSATQGLDGEKLAGFLHKPFRPNELLRKVREILH